jgi:hypothetical protein
MKYGCVRIGIAALLLMAIAGCGLVKSMGKSPEGEELTRLKAFSPQPP